MATVLKPRGSGASAGLQLAPASARSETPRPHGDDAELLRRARRFEASALAELHDRFHPAVYRFVAWRVRDPETAEDLTGEVFARLLEALRQRRGPDAHLGGWLFRVAGFVVTDHIRRRYRRPQVSLESVVLQSDANLVETAERSIRQDRLTKALQTLTEEQAEVIALRYGAGLPIREVAEAMGKSEGAVKQLQARAVAALARRMQGEGA